jgi:hypothetical protein
MQLPRGTFREIRKNVTIESLQATLEKEKFSGVSNISSETISGTLVFKGGKCILIKFQNKSGDRGWEELRKVAGEEVDVALSTLDDPQIQLALEFNKSGRVTRGSVPAHSVSQKAVDPPRPVHASQPVEKKIPAPQKPLPYPAAGAPHLRPPAAPVTAATAPEQRTVIIQGRPPHPPVGLKSPVSIPQPPPPQVYKREVPQQVAEEQQPAEPDDPSSFDEDIDTFDTMDLENVTDKIRTDCKSMIKDLNLDHLLDR